MWKIFGDKLEDRATIYSDLTNHVSFIAFEMTTGCSNTLEEKHT